MHPSLLGIAITNRKLFISRYAREMCEKFFAGMAADATAGAAEAAKHRAGGGGGAPAKKAAAIFMEGVVNVKRWPKNVVESACDALLKDLKIQYKQFDLPNEMRGFLVPHLCASADENSECATSVEVSMRDVSDFVYSLVQEVAKSIEKMPYLFLDDERTPSFLERQQTLDYIHDQALERALIDFVARYRHALESRSGTGDVVRPDPIERGPDAPAAAPGAAAPHMPFTSTSALNAASGAGASMAPISIDEDGDDGDEGEPEEGEEDGDRGYDEDAQGGGARAGGPGAPPSEEEAEDRETRKKNETEEERRERHRQEDNDIKWALDADSNNKERAKFSSEVEVADFNKYVPTKGSILKKYSKPLIDDSQTHNRSI